MMPGFGSDSHECADRLAQSKQARRPIDVGSWAHGSSASNGSGDYAIAFSTVRQPASLLSNDAMSPLFEAVVEAAEQAIYNSMFRAQTMTGRGRTIQALPLDKTIEILRRYNVIR
jgi:D-aminopeptidase